MSTGFFSFRLLIKDSFAVGRTMTTEKVVLLIVWEVLYVGRSLHIMSALVCGLDVHKDSTYATILYSEGKIVDQTRTSFEPSKQNI